MLTKRLNCFIDLNFLSGFMLECEGSSLSTRFDEVEGVTIKKFHKEI